MASQIITAITYYKRYNKFKVKRVYKFFQNTYKVESIMIIGLLLIIIALVNTIEMKNKDDKIPMFTIINCWTFPVVYVFCFLVGIFFDHSCYIYGLMAIVIEKVIYYFAKKK